MTIEGGRDVDEAKTGRSYWMDFMAWEERAAARGSGLTREQMSGASAFRSWLVNEAPDDEESVRRTELDRLRAIEAAARWLVNIHAGSIAIPAGSALGEDLAALRAALSEVPSDAR